MTAGVERRAPIEARLVAAGLPALPRTAWLEIDLDALRHNLDVLRRFAGSVSVRPVVKADAYGHGAVPVATALEAAGVDGFCVATFDEAIELRDGGIRGPLLVLYPIPAYLAREAAHADVSVTAGDPTLLAELMDATRDIATGETLEIELEVETGLGRGGFSGERLIEAARLIEAEPGLRLIGLWTHLQAVEDPDLTDRQLERFESTTNALRDASIAVPTRHVAASAAMLAGGIGLYDGVRPGLAIYGLVPDELDGVELPPGTGQALRPVMALYARPVRVETLPEGWGISYGPTFRTRRPSRIATLPIGYGDGWSRALSNRAEALVRGVRVPLVGNVAMDAVMADVTDVPGPLVGDADEFVLIGDSGTERISVGDLAHVRNTNRWEVVTGMARRLPRVYHAAAGPVGLRALTERRI